MAYFGNECLVSYFTLYFDIQAFLHLGWFAAACTKLHHVVRVATGSR